MRLLHDQLLAAILIPTIVVGVAVLVFASRLDRGDAASFIFTLF
jgi:ABC-type spermidine/putrescine transport system permease subunit II